MQRHRRRPPRPAAAPAAVLALFAACGDGPAPARPDASPPLAGRDAACGPAVACEPGLVCLDGQCRPWGWPGHVTPPPGPDALAFDAWPSDAAAPDASVPLDDAQDDGASLDADLDGLGDVALDVQPDAPADAGPDADAGPTKWLFLIGDDQAATSPGAGVLSLSPGEAWVTELALPLPGRLMGLQLVLGNGFEPDSCGDFAPAVWPLLAEEGWPNDPTWTGAAQPLTASDDPQLMLFAEDVWVTAGPWRLGLVYQGPCEPGGGPPLLGSDDSGDVDGTWLWSPQPDAPPWVPASFGGVEGRWGLRALLEVDAW